VEERRAGGADCACVLLSAHGAPTQRGGLVLSAQPSHGIESTPVASAESRDVEGTACVVKVSDAQGAPSPRAGTVSAILSEAIRVMPRVHHHGRLQVRTLKSSALSPGDLTSDVCWQGAIGDSTRMGARGVQIVATLGRTGAYGCHIGTCGSI